MLLWVDIFRPKNPLDEDLPEEGEEQDEIVLFHFMKGGNIANILINHSCLFYIFL